MTMTDKSSNHLYHHLNLCLSGIVSDMSQYLPKIFPINVTILVAVKLPEGVGIFFNLRGTEALVVVLHPAWR